jgi:hypothetical protein
VTTNAELEKPVVVTFLGHHLLMDKGETLTCRWRSRDMRQG